ncbi:MAG: U32 family peptidase [Methanomicrobiales archaeon]|nr:U32 family peptidase [Methanomicrobiales archaeon]
MNKRLPLLLAPAGSKEALYAACAAGADAVYLGGRQFGARQFAANFSNEELEHAVRYAHLRGIRVYITVNTLITEHEVSDVVRYLVYLYKIGVDGVLIQDIGLLSLAHQYIPDLTLHASTQMGIHNVPGAVFAAKHGCSRIVLARELNPEEIREIAKELSGLDVDLEIFAHGALCYAYSGRCLLSSLVGGRSGNRGMCAQPCRKLYQLESGTKDLWGRLENEKPDGHPEYLLSTKDLSVYPVLPDIVNLPVSVLKIEGRMRSPEYVAAVTSIYRKVLDAIRNRTFHPDPEDIANLTIAFSRDFTTGYVSGAGFSDVMGRKYPGNQGYCIGKIISARKGKVQVRLSSSIIPMQGDGLVIRDSDREEGLILRNNPVVNGDIIELPSPFNPKPGAQVSITKRRLLDKKISELLGSPDERYAGSLKISCSVNFFHDGKISGTGTVIDRNSCVHPFEYQSQETVEPAKTRSLSREQILEQLNKTGGTLFSFLEIVVTGEEGLFAPVRVLNTLRREILLAAEDAIIKSRIPRPESISGILKRCDDITGKKEPVQSIPLSDLELISIVSSTAEARAALENGSFRVYLLWEPSGLDISSLLEYSGRIGIMVPGVIRQKELEIFLTDFQDIISAGIYHVLVDSPGIGEYLIEKFPGISVSGYYGLPVTNSRTAGVFSDFEFCTLSPELSGQEIRFLCSGYQKAEGPDLAVCCQGLIEAAVTEDNLCSLSSVSGSNSFAIRDEKRYSFPFYCEKSGRTHILNSSEHSLVDESSDLMKLGIRRFIIDARNRGMDYAAGMTRLWKQILNDEISSEERESIREKIIEMSYHGITRSGYRRGLSGIKS